MGCGVFCFIGRCVFQECLSLDVWLTEGSELGSCGVAVFKTCLAASVTEGGHLRTGCVAFACCVPPFLK